MKPMRIALTKGRLEKDALKLFDSMGMDTSALYDKGRRLILPVGMPDGGQFEAVLAKAADVITYVEHGVCDLGIVGKDIIAEYGGSFYEVLDLGFGKCRFALAAPRGSDFFKGYSTKIVASKYPNVARGYFDRKGMDVGIIKIEGSVELAPLLELSNAIIDIVETGSTLRENGLEVIEDIMPVSARLIVNIACMKLRKKEIEAFVSKMEECL
ncbi:MAG: ATP phosphoribosyltransferase [Oscillospiraceae bacterium]|jgi:ATP phosphoribosyltransferase|nr:ATP phosphoribosyltransferase [Oscillospiraceae bacterium]